MRRVLLLTAVLGAVLAVPAVAGATPDLPDVPEANIAESVRGIETTPSVRGIDLSEAVIPLETEEDDGEQVTVRISADVLFDFGEATLTDAAERRIAELAKRLRDVRGTVEVSGHTDSVGTDAYNLDLSKRRAEAVKAELQRSLQGASLRIEAKGYGETEPVVPNEKGGQDDPEGRAKNRRVDITYEKG
ncbi:OmpA family protein [Actinomadura livida]|uniref:Outer membrane protein OmpA-like peptidoglycan-associated protein n=1 Tax=Actinomadura livida TaxID=79909 RepID=A0A7W7IA22_9ACTN|nr:MULTISPECIES: OmpA family protein [Actinomadura]MBB4773321.1 outer membrane protein OmpA-like peptidoglycan-associated protein [Actinomadura catellatispora]